MAKALARQVGYIYIDSGAMYRAVTLFCLENDLVKDGRIDAEGLRIRLPEARISFRNDGPDGALQTYLNNRCVEQEIRTLRVSSLVSPVAALPFVREELVRQQQEMGRQKGIVMDGRDIGTAVFPEAELKIFVTASAEVRAQRRYDELTAKGDNVCYEDILQNVVERDRIDSTREVSPLRQADDAVVLDNSHLSIPEQNEWLMREFRRATAE